MALQNKCTSILNVNRVENLNNKVYINPNFNRPQTGILSNNSVMHVNPNFSHLVSNVPGNKYNKNKIYVNPNFIKSQRVFDKQSIEITTNKCTVFDMKNMDSSTNQQPQQKDVPSQVPISKSRYCLVRQNEPKQPVQKPVSEKATFKLSRYKTVPWNDVKRNLVIKNTTNNISSITAPIDSNPTSQGNKKYSCLTISSKNKFRLINRDVPLVKPDRINLKSCTDIKKVFRSPQITPLRLRKKGNLKKNNIPCPLFRKFGTCLRNDRGSCEFLHDKKHVSICRKFIKGLCHDKECLLSHDLTTKKMPTCYFYLQGTCTKADCPYLHVKLNEKAKVCQDFLKGYCEKGSKCLQRHINSERKTKLTMAGKSSKRVKSNFIMSKSLNCRSKDIIQNIEAGNENHSKIVKSDINSESRYYQEHQKEKSDDSCKVIKPLRCKLGTLPSYIQL